MCICEPYFNGQPVVKVVETIFSDCLYSWTDITSFCFGWASILCWMVCLFPQFWINYKIKRVDGLSIMFIAEWALGDATNFAGCMLTNALPTQRYQAAYFLLCDVGLLTQWFYYRNMNKRYTTIGDRYGSLAESDRSDSQRWKVNSSPRYQPPEQNRSLLTIIALFALCTQGLALEPAPGCLDTKTITGITAICGTVVAWVSGTIYFVSRFPQIWKNYKRQSTEGLSLGMFMLAILGNGTYGLSIMLRFPQIDSDFLKNKLPYLIGSVGTFIFDITIFIQFRLYKNKRGPTGYSFANSINDFSVDLGGDRLSTTQREMILPAD